MKFPMIVYKNEESDYCGLLPDFPGIFMAGTTLDELMQAAQDAVETWMDGEDRNAFPKPSPIDQVASSSYAKGRAILLTDIDTNFLGDDNVNVSFSIPRHVLELIDEAAIKGGLNRTDFLVETALSAAKRQAVNSGI